MKRITFQKGLIFVLTVCLYGFLFAEGGLELSEGLKNKQVAMNIKARGGYLGKTLEIGVKNLTAKPLKVRINAGQIFVSKDTTVQDLIVTDTIWVEIAPQQAIYTAVPTMCTQSFNRSPGKSEVFNIGEMASGNLLTLALCLSANNISSSTAQSAVWAVANGDPVADIYGNNPKEMKILAYTLSELLKIPVHEFKTTAIPHHITDINSSLEWRTEYALENASLEIWDEDGKLMRTYFSGRKYRAGFQQHAFGFYHTDTDSTKHFFVRLKNNGSLIAEKEITPQDEPLPLNYYNSEKEFHFLAEQPEKVNVILTDEKGDLFMPLTYGMDLPQGFHNKTFVIGKNLPKDKQYYLRIVTEGGKVLQEKPIGMEDKARPKFEPMTQKGIITFPVEKELNGVSLMIVNENGETMMLFYQKSRLAPGNKQYSYTFRHYDGPQATFTVRLVNEEGTILMEKPLNR
ncbi:MAG: hypothetical protein K1X92_04610 [Bacteroidia bacterium]|nr:hypothetical protein [Bacteroidia bacterium]